MIKGTQRSIVVLKNTGSELFEEAHFILRKSHTSGVNNKDILTEASKIISDNSVISDRERIQREKRASMLRYVLMLALGFFVGAFLTAAILLLL